MGDLISTGISDQGHSITFEYVGEGAEQKCFMKCVCGWSTEIESSMHPWSLIETKVKFQKHLDDLALKDAGITHSFQDKNGDSYTFTLDDGQVKLDCYLMGSILGGTGTECIHTVNGPKIKEFFVQLGVRDASDLDQRLPAYEAKDWQELHQVIMKYQTDSFVWEETDWSDSINVTVAVIGEGKVGCVLAAVATATSTEGTFPITYQWYSNDGLEGSYQLIESATKPTYLLEDAERGKFVRVGASASDGIGFNSSSSPSNSLGPIT